MFRSTRTEEHDDRGVVTLELVLAIPVLLMLIIGTVVLGSYLSQKTRVTGFARDAAREASLGKELPTEDGFTFTFEVGPCPTPPDPKESVRVRATTTVTLRSIPFLPTFIPDTISETVTMRCGG
ncbi:MAG TPA: TadE family protein [Ilumatobacteraceae bacterium]|nr:TadE family protein [Ilumatobacteraceae bacterium]